MMKCFLPAESHIEFKLQANREGHFSKYIHRMAHEVVIHLAFPQKFITDLLERAKTL